MEEKVTLIFGHKNPDTDSICSSLVMEDLEKKLGNINCKAVRTGKINNETKYVFDYLNLKDIEFIEDVEDNQPVILIDHNEASQCVNNISNAKILKVIDHHTMNFKAPYQLYYRAEPVGCTATVLYKLYKENNFEISPQIATLALSAIISDTLLFKSPTCTKEDVDVCNALAKIAGIDVNTYGLEMLKAGTDLSEFTAEELINIDSKEFVEENFKFQIAQVNTACIDDVLKSKDEIESAMNNFMKENGTNLFILLITDIINSNSQAIVLGDTSVFEKAFNKKVENNMAFLEGVVSRKKQVAPVILNVL